MGKPQPLSIAIQGERCSYSYEALLRVYGEQVDLVSLTTLAEVFQAVECGQVEEALVPLAHSLTGPVAAVAALLQASPVSIIGDVWHPIHHCLLALPGQSLAEITRAMSHPQALAECRTYLRPHQIAEIGAYDTAGSARVMRQEQVRGTAAIASANAGKVYHLEVLASNIESDPANTTHFVLVKRSPARLVVSVGGTHPSRRKTL